MAISETPVNLQPHEQEFMRAELWRVIRYLKEKYPDMLIKDIPTNNGETCKYIEDADASNFWFIGNHTKEAYEHMQLMMTDYEEHKARMDIFWEKEIEKQLQISLDIP